MFLRANGVSLYFPIHDAPRRLAPSVASHEDRLGGTRMAYRGKPVIRALHDVNLSLGKGDRLGVIGHNGSGKSTLLRVLSGIYHPQEGTVECDRAVSGIFNMSIGFRQETSGYRNIVLKGLMAGRSRREIEEAVPHIEELSGLGGGYLSMPLHTYSQGMALRLAFAITTTFAHDILVMDEWIGAGDAQFQERVVARMKSLLESTHICVIASHNNQLLRRITDTCLWLEDGAVRMLGETANVLEAYEAEARQNAQATQPARLPIPEDYPGLRMVEPRPDPSSPPVLAWDVEELNVLRVKLTVATPPNGTEQIVCTGPAKQSRVLGAWVRSGQVFRLRDQLDDAVLGTVVIP